MRETRIIMHYILNWRITPMWMKDIKKCSEIPAPAFSTRETIWGYGAWLKVPYLIFLIGIYILQLALIELKIIGLRASIMARQMLLHAFLLVYLLGKKLRLVKNCG